MTSTNQVHPVLDADTSSLIDLIDNYLNTLKNSPREESVPVTPFLVSAIPTITVKDYLTRSALYLQLNTKHFIYMLIYLERYLDLETDFLHSYNTHRLLFAIIVLTHHRIDTPFETREFYGKVGGLNRAQLDIIQRSVGSKLEGSLTVSHEDYLKAKRDLAQFARQLEETDSCTYLIDWSEQEELELIDLQAIPKSSLDNNREESYNRSQTFFAASSPESSLDVFDINNKNNNPAC